MKAAVAIPVTVKCRIGIDEQDPEEALEALTQRGRGGRRRCADRACAQGLARRPVAAREPRHPAARLRPRLSAQGARIRDLPIVLNGGIADLEQARGASRACRRRDDGPRRLSGAVAAAGGRSAAVRRGRAVRHRRKAGGARRSFPISSASSRAARGCMPSPAMCSAVPRRAGRARLPPASGDRGGQARRGRCRRSGEALALVVDSAAPNGANRRVR